MRLHTEVTWMLPLQHPCMAVITQKCMQVYACLAYPADRPLLTSCWQALLRFLACATLQSVPGPHQRCLCCKVAVVGRHLQLMHLQPQLMVLQADTHGQKVRWVQGDQAMDCWNLNSSSMHA